MQDDNSEGAFYVKHFGEDLGHCFQDIERSLQMVCHQDDLQELMSAISRTVLALPASMQEKVALLYWFEAHALVGKRVISKLTYTFGVLYGKTVSPEFDELLSYLKNEVVEFPPLEDLLREGKGEPCR